MRYNIDKKEINIALKSGFETMLSALSFILFLIAIISIVLTGCFIVIYLLRNFGTYIGSILSMFFISIVVFLFGFVKELLEL